MIVHPYHVTLFSKTCQNLLLLLDFFKACESILIRNIRFLTISFITTTLNDILNKNRCQHNTSYVVITLSRLAGMKFCPVLTGSRQCYKLFINYILRLHVKSFIPARRDPSFVLPGSRFAGTKFFHVIASTRLSGMKKLIENINRSTFQ